MRRWKLHKYLRMHYLNLNFSDKIFEKILYSHFFKIKLILISYIYFETCKNKWQLLRFLYITILHIINDKIDLRIKYFIDASLSLLFLSPNKKSNPLSNPFPYISNISLARTIFEINRNLYISDLYSCLKNSKNNDKVTHSQCTSSRVVVALHQ